MKQLKLVKKLSVLLKQLNQREYFHRLCPKKYTFLDHILALLLKEVMNSSFRRISNLLIKLGIEVPTYSALCKSRKRIPLILRQRLLTLTAGFSSGEVAIDGTGFSKTNPSFHYLKRIDGVNPKNYTKLSALLDIKTKKFLVMRIRTTPRHDMQDVKYLLKRVGEVRKFYGDKGYCAE